MRRRTAPLFEGLEPRRLLAAFAVDHSVDENDGDFSAGNLSLREAIIQSNTSAGADTITFAPLLSGQTITLNGTELPAVTGPLTITGPGSFSLTVACAGASRAFTINDGVAGSAAVAISGLTVSGGAAGAGAGLVNFEGLTLTDVRFTSNAATGAGGAVSNSGALTVNAGTFDANTSGTDGGAINNLAGGTVSLTSVYLAGNTAGGNGGAVSNHGTLVLTGSSVYQNSSTAAGAGLGGGIFNASGSVLVMNGGSLSGNTATARGGAISNAGDASLFDASVSANSAILGGGGIDHTGGTLVLERATLSTNNTGGDGGGVLSGAALTLTNSTVSANTAGNFGGGLAVTGGAATISNSTIAFNGADTDNTSTGLGGGLYVTGAAPVVTSTIVARNTASMTTTANDVALGTGGSLSGANSLIGDAASAGGIVGGASGNIVGVDPRLGPLAANGGEPRTHTLKAGSPAIDTGANTLSLATDQRGYARVGGAAADIGAYETRVYPTTAGPARLVRGAADNTDAHRVVTLNQDNAVLVFEQGWIVANLQELTGAPAATSDPVIWVDPKDNLTYVAAPSDAGLILFTRGADGSWSFRNLATEDAAPESPSNNLTQFTSIGGIVFVVGMTDSGKIAAFQQTLATAPGGGPAFAYVDISAQIIANGAASTPAITGLISYVTTWDAWNVAGIDANGDIQVVWLVLTSFNMWRLDNLSEINHAPAITGQLAVTLTYWGGINLAGLDAGGDLITTWWVPGAQWRTNNLTAETVGGIKLISGQVTGYSTPWGGLNYVGLNSTGEVIVYWWAPGKADNLVWDAVPLLPASVPDSARPLSTLTAYSSGIGTLNVFGTSPTSDALRLWWTPGPTNLVWNAEDLTASATKH